MSEAEACCLLLGRLLGGWAGRTGVVETPVVMIPSENREQRQKQTR